MKKKKKTIYQINILEKGFNGEEFMDFLTKLKGENGTNLSNWTLDEIKMVKKN